MKSFTTKVTIITIALLCSLSGFAQDINRMLPDSYDPDKNKIIPDKVFEFGLPLLVLFMIANTILGIFKVRADNKLKEKALDKNLSESTLIALFARDKSLYKYNFFKWFLILGAFGLALICIHFLLQFTHFGSGYLSLGIITLFMSIAFLIYYKTIQAK